MSRTTHETTKALLKSILTKLEKQEMIALIPEKRLVALDEVYQRMAPWILTEDDLHQKTVDRLGASREALDDTHFTETDKYRTAKAMLRRDLGENELHGMYYQKSVRHVANEIARFLMDCKSVDDVFASDQDIERAVVESIQKFDPKNLH